MLVETWFGDAVIAFIALILSPLGSEACDVVSVRDASAKERAAFDEL